MENERVFVSGMFIKKAPTLSAAFVKLDINFKADEMIAFLKKYKDDKGWVNTQMLQAESGRYYGQLNNWKPEGDVNRRFDEVTSEESPF